MLLRPLSALLLAATQAFAFRNAHPFFMLLSDPSGKYTSLEYPQLSTSSDLQSLLSTDLASCEHTEYVVYVQPGATANDVANLPRLQERIKARRNETLLQIPEVLGSYTGTLLADELTALCGSEQVFLKPLGQITASTKDGRKKQMAQTDETISQHIDELRERRISYALIYAGQQLRSSETPPYEMDESYPSGLHTDLKRDVELHGRRQRRGQAGSTDNTQYDLPLFESYSFLSPALFMGLTVFLLLFLIAYVGVSAIAGLEVSYFAFSKEMGSQAQGRNKQQ